MIISWRKYGILVPVIFLGGVYVGHVLLKIVNKSHGRWESVTMFVPGLLLLAIGSALDRKQQPNEFCFFRMIIWGGVAIVFGGVVLYTG